MHHAVIAAVIAGLSAACAERGGEEWQAAAAGRCPSGPVDNYLATRWQQCWFDAASGRWRTLSHDFHYDVLIVEVEAASLDDAEEITRRFVGLHAGRFMDITIYVYEEPASMPGPIRRVHWASGADELDTLDFTGARGQ